MAHVHCPKCGERLNLPPIQETRGARCPACKHEFTVSPPSQPQSLPGDYTGEGAGVLTKAFLAVLATLSIALIAVLIYKMVAGPDSTEESPQPVPIVAKNTDPKPQSPKPKPPKEHRPKPKKVPTTKPTGESVAKPVPLSPEQIFAKASPSVVYIVVRDKNFKPIGLGSGFFIDSKGPIVTNHHVIKGAEFATALLSNKSTLFVDGVTAVDADNDLAILQVSGKDFPNLKAADTLPKIGSAVYAIGNPRGLENTFSSGMVSGHREFKQGVKFIQTTTPISPGSSGGPLLNIKGEVVGVTTSYRKGGQNLNFAVPIAKVRELLGNQSKVRTLASAGGYRLDKSATAELDKAWEAMRKKDWPTATRILTTLRKTQKDNPFVWFALGRLHIWLRNDAIAIQHYRVAISLKPDYAEAYRWMGSAYAGLKRYTDAIAAYKTAVALKPDFAKAYSGMGLSYRSMKRYTKAIVAYKKVIAINPDDGFTYFFMGQIYHRDLKQYTDAIAAYKKAIAINPDDAVSYTVMGEVYDDLKRHTEAMAAYNKAMACYKKDIAIEPDSANTYFWMGDLYQKLKQYRDAIAAYRKGIALKPDTLVAYAYHGMGSAYVKLGERAAAIAAYQQYLRMVPTGPGAELVRLKIRELRDLEEN